MTNAENANWLEMNEAIKRAGNASALPVIDAGNEPGITKVIERHEHKFLADGLHSNEAGKAIPLI
jgi:hypothetical protein